MYFVCQYSWYTMYMMYVNALIPPARDLCSDTNPKQEGVKVFYNIL